MIRAKNRIHMHQDDDKAVAVEGLVNVDVGLIAYGNNENLV